MFSFRDYNNFLVQIHLREKSIFYTYKYMSCIKPIILLFKYVILKYKVFDKIYDHSTFIGNQLFFYSCFNSRFKLKNLSFSNYNSYSVTITNNFIYKYNLFHYNTICYLFDHFKNKYHMELVQNSSEYNLDNKIKLNVKRLSSYPSNDLYQDIKGFNSLLNFSLKMNSNNYFLNRIFLSHVLLNV